MENLIMFYKKYYTKIYESLSEVDESELNNIIKLIKKTSKNNGKIIMAGNGGSASISSHVTIDLTKAANIRAINFNEPNLITCFSNDFGYENWVKMALEYYCNKNDMVILISSSGQSPNIINAAKYCIKQNINLVTFSGFKKTNSLRKLGTINLWVNSVEYNIVEMTHHIWILSLIDKLIEEKHI